MKFKIGDKVRLITNNFECKAGFNYGEICEVVRIERSNSYPIAIKNVIIGYAREDELELIEKNNNRLTKYEIDEEDLDKEKLDDMIPGTATDYRIEYSQPTWSYNTDNYISSLSTTIPF